MNVGRTEREIEIEKEILLLKLVSRFNNNKNN